MKKVLEYYYEELQRTFAKTGKTAPFTLQNIEVLVNFRSYNLILCFSMVISDKNQEGEKEQLREKRHTKSKK